MTGVKRILIVAPAWVGDMVMSHSLIQHLAKKHPHSLIDVLAPASTLPLAERMAEVNKGILLEAGHGQLLLDYRRHLGNSLSAARYQQAFVLPNSLKSALVPFFAGIETRTGYRGEYRYFLINDMHLLNEKLRPLLIERFVGLAVGPNKPMPDQIAHPEFLIDEANIKSLEKEHGLDRSRPVVGICPGAEYGNAKKWPEAYYAELAKDAITKGYQIWVFGSNKDSAAGERIKNGVADDNCIDLSGKTRLLDAVDLLSLCQLVVTNDSGLMHVACAVGTRTIAIYGSSSPQFTPPLSKEAEIVSLNLSCSPCFKRECPLGHTNCLNQLLPERVCRMIAKPAVSP